MTEDDWGILERWDSDPVVMYYDGDVGGYGPEMVRDIYRGVSQRAFCFIIEYNGRAVGETYLQKMNLERILVKFPDKDIRRIDIMIGEKDHWGRGIGTKAVEMLLEFGFEEERADAIFGCDVDESNVRSVKMFRKLGFEEYSGVSRTTNKGERCLDMILERGKYQRSRQRDHHP
jgi:aminoglycoside 6'-N-acetyltransferase